MLKKLQSSIFDRKIISVSVTVVVGLCLFGVLWVFNNENAKEREDSVKVYSAQNEPVEIEVGESDYQKVLVEDFVGDRIIIFHNGAGEDTKQANGFVNTLTYQVEEYVYPEGQSKGYFLGLKDFYKESLGESDSFGYFPVIFIQDKAYSGWNDEIEAAIAEQVYFEEESVK